MLKKNISIFFLFVIHFSFAQNITNTEAKATFKLFVGAIDLSENVSTLSTNNDELLVLLYKNDSVVQAPIFEKYFVLDTLKRNELMSFNSDKKKDGKYTLFLIEMDTYKTIEQIEPTVRIYFDTIIKLFNTDKTGLAKYLGDDDILGIQEIEFDSSKDNNRKEYKFQGNNFLDYYSYLISIN